MQKISADFALLIGCVVARVLEIGFDALTPGKVSKYNSILWR